MTGIGIWLAVVGLCDLGRADGDLTARWRRLTVVGVGILLFVVAAASADPAGRGWWGWTLGAAGFAVWVLGSASALARGQVQPPGVLLMDSRLRFAVAYAGLAGGLVAVIVCAPQMGSIGGLERLVAASALGTVPADRVMVAVGVVLLQVATANIAVRLLLDLVGVPAHDNEKRLRGGRILGPMERVLVVGLGAAGSLTGASLVIAAKALLRFPELRAPDPGGSPHGGPSDVTEYFLVGSLASWMLALGGVALLGIV